MNLVTSHLRGGVLATPQVLTDPRGLEADRIPLIRQYLRIAMRWRYVILGVVAACVILGLIAIVFRLATSAGKHM